MGLSLKYRELEQEIFKQGLKQYVYFRFQKPIFFLNHNSLFKASDSEKLRNLKLEYIAELKSADVNSHKMVMVLVIGVLLTVIAEIIQQTIQGK